MLLKEKDDFDQSAQGCNSILVSLYYFRKYNLYRLILHFSLYFSYLKVSCVFALLFLSLTRDRFDQLLHLLHHLENRCVLGPFFSDVVVLPVVFCNLCWHYQRASLCPWLSWLEYMPIIIFLSRSKFIGSIHIQLIVT